MKTIPKAAMPVVEIIRRDVPRPEELPVPGYVGKWLRWKSKHRIVFRCPMGLCAGSNQPAPGVGSEFAGGICTTTAVKTFYRWWDKLTDPQAAVDAVWPK